MPVVAPNPSLGLLQALLGLLRPPESDPSMQLLTQYLQQSGGTEDAFRNLMQARHQDPQNLALRNAEHAAFAQTQLDELGPLLGTLFLLSAVPAYSGYKAGVQALPPGVGAEADRVAKGLGIFPVARSTPPDRREIQFGLLPLLGGFPQVTEVP